MRKPLAGNGARRTKRTSVTKGQKGEEMLKYRGDIYFWVYGPGTSLTDQSDWKSGTAFSAHLVSWTEYAPVASNFMQIRDKKESAIP
jgi:hypothetical protein